MLAAKKKKFKTPGSLAEKDELPFYKLPNCEASSHTDDPVLNKLPEVFFQTDSRLASESDLETKLLKGTRGKPRITRRYGSTSEKFLLEHHINRNKITCSMPELVKQGSADKQNSLSADNTIIDCNSENYVKQNPPTTIDNVKQWHAAKIKKKTLIHLTTSRKPLNTTDNASEVQLHVHAQKINLKKGPKQFSRRLLLIKPVRIGINPCNNKSTGDLSLGIIKDPTPTSNVLALPALESVMTNTATDFDTKEDIPSASLSCVADSCEKIRDLAANSALLGTNKRLNKSKQRSINRKL